MTIQSEYLYIDCMDEEGSSPQGVRWSYASCSKSNYVVTSCGAKARHTSNDDMILGSYINGTQCVAQSRCALPGDKCHTGGIYAYARCCNITDYRDGHNSSSITTYQSMESNAHIINRDETSVSCNNSNEVIIGCTGRHDGNGGLVESGAMYDGHYVGYKSNHTGNVCTARDGLGSDGVWSYATCYDTSTLPTGYSMECRVIWGNDGWESTVSCPLDGTNWFMTSCSGYSLWAEMDQYIIEDNICKVIYGGGIITQYSTASAIWLSEYNVSQISKFAYVQFVYTAAGYR